MFRNVILGTVAVLAVGAIIAAVPSESYAGRVGGAITIQGHAAPDDYDTYTIRFQGGRLAHVFVKSINRADLDIKIIDPVTLRVVAQDLRSNPNAHVDFIPDRTREYIVLIHNFSRDRGTRYVLHTN
ncbi:MAG: hypothetical protein FJ303_06960 [Planctomycetes bacterium]|nr:hypothetical protein [Planctomycetota bacterium]